MRQGWGWDERQNLRKLELNEGAKRNLPIFNKVKKGDILIIPRLPTWSEVAIVEATEDFCDGYEFKIDSELKDFGHCFPAKIIKPFVRQNKHVNGDIRASIKNPSRFWNMNQCADSIEALIKQSSDLKDTVTHSARFNNALNDGICIALDQSDFYENLYSSLNETLSNEEWEYALVEGLRKILPEPIMVERTGGITEKEHGTDILIKYPGLLGRTYGVAIQVKDYEGVMSGLAIHQINKSTTYWDSENIKIIEKYVIVTKCKKENNQQLEHISGDVSIIFSCELKDLLKQIADGYIGLSN
ncbi:hypothetical protein [Parashewanella spongiae]|uniref:hypothetical protein n=1 Tax=Parashewanella spongiae TaxID=342950 RepID=UPI001C5537EB|nr:hypothetical protein [Parashewanella spongiae]USN27176.1 hypothetical protein [synthetic construct]